VRAVDRDHLACRAQQRAAVALGVGAAGDSGGALGHGGGEPNDKFGRDEISAFTRQVRPGGMKGLTITMDVTHVLFIRADVAAVKVRQLYASDDGRPSEDAGEGTPMFVMSKEDGQWSLVACQNTGVLDA